MSETKVTNIYEYLKKVDTEIERLKSEGKHRHFLFNVIFGGNGNLDEFKSYYAGKKIMVDVKPCGCAENRCDIFLEWK